MPRVLNAAGLAIFALVLWPTSVVASDFSGMLIDAAFIVGGISLVCLVAGYLTKSSIGRAAHFN